jgi:hypothetical protein
MTLGVPDFELTRGDLLFRLQRSLGLIPENGLGLVRRALFWTALGWLPIAVWAIVTLRALPGIAAEPLLAHFGIHARLLVAVPLLVLAEGPANAATAQLLRHFIVAGVVPDAGRAAYVEAVQRATRWRDAAWPWLVMLAVAVALGTYSQTIARSHEVDWAGDGSLGFGFGGYWYLYVGRTIFLTLVLGWIWRIGLLAGLLASIARLDLALVPSHADRTGGLGFLQRLPAVFAPLALALGIVLASRWAHDAVYHGLALQSVKVEMLVFVALCVAVFSAPLLFFHGPLKRARARALLDYGALVGRQGRLVHARWIEGASLKDEPLLDAPELGPVADVNALYEAVRAMRTVPLGKASVMPVALAAALPMLAVLALQVPVAALLKRLVHAIL